MKVFTLILSLFLFAQSLWAGDVSFSWNASTSENVVGYRVYAGTSPRSYSIIMNAGNSLTYTVKNLAGGLNYFFAATAYDAANNESDYSNEVSAVVPADEFKITTLSVSMRWFGVVLLCTTSKNASAILRYTNLSTNEQQTVIATIPSALKTEHRAILYLPMGTQVYYKYEWSVEDATGVKAVLGGTFQVR